ncbi:MAG: hypothetical protein DRJ52_11445 [Thermoprotei archaeon]|nr:MAG: hypothetical protein DRJ52_11445 [Thermoprotei archaeon]
MICSADLMYTILLLGLNLLALVIGLLKGEKKRKEYSPLLIIRKPKHILLNNLLAYMPSIVPLLGVLYSLYLFYTTGKTLRPDKLLKTYVFLELVSASILTYSGFLLLAYRPLDLAVFLTTALTLLALSAYTEGKELGA